MIVKEKNRKLDAVIGVLSISTEHWIYGYEGFIKRLVNNQISIIDVSLSEKQFMIRSALKFKLI